MCNFNYIGIKYVSLPPADNFFFPNVPIRVIGIYLNSEIWKYIQGVSKMDDKIGVNQLSRSAILRRRLVNGLGTLSVHELIRDTDENIADASLKPGEIK